MTRPRPGSVSRPIRPRSVDLLTPRLRLREFTPDDVPGVLAYQRDPLYLRYYEGDDRTMEQVRDLVGQFVAWQADAPRFRWQMAVEWRETGEMIGNVGLRRMGARSPEADLGYELAPAWWGRGIATEAAEAMLRFGFETQRLDRIHAHCVLDNEGSARVLEKIGLRREGILREHEQFKGRWWDVQLFGILREEWEQLSRR